MTHDTITQDFTADCDCQYSNATQAWSATAIDPAQLLPGQTLTTAHRFTCDCDCHYADATQACTAMAIDSIGPSPGQMAPLRVCSCPCADASLAAGLGAHQSVNSAEAPPRQAAGISDLAFHAFPSIQQLSEASEDALRAQGFGYR